MSTLIKTKKPVRLTPKSRKAQTPVIFAERDPVSGLLVLPATPRLKAITSADVARALVDFP
jgi:hypothetical protein